MFHVRLGGSFAQAHCLYSSADTMYVEAEIRSIQALACSADDTAWQSCARAAAQQPSTTCVCLQGLNTASTETNSGSGCSFLEWPGVPFNRINAQAQSQFGKTTLHEHELLRFLISWARYEAIHRELGQQQLRAPANSEEGGMQTEQVAADEVAEQWPPRPLQMIEAYGCAPSSRCVRESASHLALADDGCKVLIQSQHHGRL
jgi:hypothetical protein